MEKGVIVFVDIAQPIVNIFEQHFKDYKVIKMNVDKFDSVISLSSRLKLIILSNNLRQSFFYKNILANEKLKDVPIVIFNEKNVQKTEFVFLDTTSQEDIEFIQDVHNVINYRCYDDNSIIINNSILEYLDYTQSPFLILKIDLGKKSSSDCFKVLFCNNSFAKMKGFKSGIELQRNSNILTDKYDLKLIETAYSLCNTSNTYSTIEELSYDNKIYKIDLYKTLIDTCVIFYNDITSYKILQDEAYNSLKREVELVYEKKDDEIKYGYVLDQTGVVVFEWNNLSDRIYSSQNISLYACKDVFNGKVPKDNVFLKYIHNEDLQIVIDTFNDMHNSTQSMFEAVLRLQKYDSSYVWVKVNFKVNRDENNKIYHGFGMISNVDNQIMMMNKLKRTAEYDSLTNIFNKESFLIYTRNIIDKNSNINFSIIQFNLHHFRVINNLFRYEVGDDILKYLASGIKNILVQYNPVTYGHFFSDIYAICVQSSIVLEVINKIEKLCKEYKLDIEIIPSFGIYNIDNPCLSIQAMFDRASAAARTVKDNYVIRYAYFDSNMETELLIEQEIISEMNNALENKQFVVYYQPQYDIIQNKVIGAEALVRWFHPTKGMILPGNFIPVFERNGFITKLDEYVWNTVCLFLREQIDQGIDPLPISVNVSRVNFLNPKLVDIFLGLIKKYNLSPKLLQLELTESTYTINYYQLNDIIKRFKDYGFLILMDDFGSGYSSLNMLKEISVDVLKVDLRFLSCHGEGNKGGSILSSVIRMSKWLNINVVCEGVETKTQVDFLKSVGCDCVQGFYFSKPISKNNFFDLIKNYNYIKKDDEFMKYDLDEIWNPNDKLSLLFNSMVSAIGVYEMTNRKIEVVRLNDQYFELIKAKSRSFNNFFNILDYIHEDDQEIIYQMFDEAFNTQKTSEAVYRRKIDDGSYIWLHTKMKFVCGDKNHGIYFGFMNDITKEKNIQIELDQAYHELKMANEALLLKYEHEVDFRNYFTKSSVSFFEIDITDNKLVDISKNLNNRYKVSIGDKGTIILEKLIKDGVCKEFSDLLKEKLNYDYLLNQFSKNNNEIKIEYIANGLNSTYWVDATISLYQSKKSDHIYLSWLGKNVDEKKKYEISLKEKSEKDSLTGLLNAISFRHLIADYLEDNIDGTFFMLDIDNFKLINDCLGHLVGDQVIKSIASILAVNFRNDLCARLGGDEFSVFIKKSCSNYEIENICKNVLSRVTELKSIYKNQNITLSIGVVRSSTIIEQSDINYTYLYSCADKALYHAKRNGKDDYSIYEEDSMHSKLRIIIADSNEQHRNRLASLFDKKYEVLVTTNGKETYDLLVVQKQKASIIIIDNQLSYISGLDLLKMMKESNIELNSKIIFMINNDNRNIKLKALDYRISYIINDDEDEHVIMKLVDNIIMQRR